MPSLVGKNETMQPSRESSLSKLKKMGADLESTALQNATDDQLLSLAEGLEKLRDNRLARFITTIIQTQN
jgi:hypothetical protein